MGHVQLMVRIAHFLKNQKYEFLKLNCKHVPLFLKLLKWRDLNYNCDLSTFQKSVFNSPRARFSFFP